MQSHFASLLESGTNTGLNYLFQLVTQMLVFPLFGIVLGGGASLQLAAIFTGIALVRGYAVRRYFNGSGLQSRLGSAGEAVFNVMLGYWVAFVASLFLFPLYGVVSTIPDMLAIGAVFTVISLVRTYAVRRFFIWAERRRAPVCT